MTHRKRSKSASAAADQDTPGRPKSAASRQQTHPDQGIQTGNPHMDSKTKGGSRSRQHVRNEK